MAIYRHIFSTALFVGYNKEDDLPVPIEGDSVRGTDILAAMTSNVLELDYFLSKI